MSGTNLDNFQKECVAWVAGLKYFGNLLLGQPILTLVNKGYGFCNVANC
jgi:hypothetical protein